MKCNKCGETYRGLAGDCSCTAYSDGTPRVYKPKEGVTVRLIPAYIKTAREQLAAFIDDMTEQAKRDKVVIMLQGDPIIGGVPEPKKPIEPTRPLTGRAPLVLDGREV